MRTLSYIQPLTKGVHAKIVRDETSANRSDLFYIGFILFNTTNSMTELRGTLERDLKDTTAQQIYY